MQLKIIEKMLQGDRLSLARVISFIEDRGADLRAIVDAIYPKTGNAFILGITGPPGAGKSTCTDRIVAQARKAGKRVAVIAIDPSSPFSGGAILGDRIRMQSHSGDMGVYIRSLGTRGKHGGLSQSSKEVVMALDAAGFDWIIVETAGVGQTELDIMKLAHCVCVVLVPESGDGIQVMKAGLMEIADLFVVNKSDRPEADKIVRELTTMIAMNRDAASNGGMQYKDHAAYFAAQAQNPSASAWEIPVLKTQATVDQGIAELFQKLEAYREYGLKHGTFERKRATFLEEEIIEILWSRASESIRAKLASADGKKLLESVLKKKKTPYEAADSLE